MEIITTDTYEASYYLYHYAHILKIEKRKVPDNKIKKKGYYVEAKIYLTDVREVDNKNWMDEKAYANVVSFSRMRCRLKKILYKVGY